MNIEPNTLFDGLDDKEIEASLAVLNPPELLSDGEALLEEHEDETPLASIISDTAKEFVNADFTRVPMENTLHFANKLIEEFKNHGYIFDKEDINSLCFKHRVANDQGFPAINLTALKSEIEKYVFHEYLSDPQSAEADSTTGEIINEVLGEFKGKPGFSPKSIELISVRIQSLIINITKSAKKHGIDFGDTSNVERILLNALTLNQSGDITFDVTQLRNDLGTLILFSLGADIRNPWKYPEKINGEKMTNPMQFITPLRSPLKQSLGDFNTLRPPSNTEFGGNFEESTYDIDKIVKEVVTDELNSVENISRIYRQEMKNIGGPIEEALNS